MSEENELSVEKTSHNEVEENQEPMRVMPPITVNEVWRVYDEGFLSSEVPAALIAFASRRHINEISDADWSTWDPDTQMWNTTPEADLFNDVMRQFADAGKIHRNEFTGLATYDLAIPFDGKAQIIFQNSASLKQVMLGTPSDGYHEVEAAVWLISRLTGEPIETLRKMYVGDFRALQTEINHLMSAPLS